MNNTKPETVQQVQAAVAALLDELPGARAVVFATADGFDLAHATRGAVDPARLAAMVSSFAALGDMASREAGIGASRCLVVESTEGRLVVRCIELRGESLVVVVLTELSALLGLIWNALAAAERRMTLT